MYMATTAGKWMIICGMIFAFSPIAVAYLTGIPEYFAGCQVDEGSVHSCIVFGHEIGPLLYSMFVAGWFVLLTFPLGVGVAVLGVLLMVIGRMFGA